MWGSRNTTTWGYLMGRHSTQQKEQHLLADSTTLSGSRGEGTFWQLKQQQTPEQQALARAPKEDKMKRQVPFLSWLTELYPEKKRATLASPRKELVWGREDLIGSKRPALVRKVMTQEISSHMFILNSYISSEVMSYLLQNNSVF